MCSRWNFIALILSRSFRQMLANFFGSWILKACIEVQEKRKRVVFLLVTSSSKREIRQVHVVVVQRRHRNVQEGVIHVLSCCFVNLLLLLFCCVLVAVSVRILMCEEPGDKLESDRHWQLPLILGKIVVSLKLYPRFTRVFTWQWWRKVRHFIPHMLK